MEGFSFARGRALNAKFSGADMQGTFLSGTNFTNADFSEANMRGAVIGRHFLFDERKPLGCFQGANLTNANLKNANLDLVWLVGVKGLTCQRLMEAKNWSNTRRDPELTCGAIIPDLAKAYAYIETWPQKCDEK